MFNALKKLVDEIDWNDWMEEVPDGEVFTHSDHSVVVCTGYAETFVNGILPQTFPDAHCEVRGRFYEDSEAYPIGQFNDGHDLCVVNDRYIIDVWPKLVENQDWETVLDFQNPQHNKLFEERYGPFNKY